jgi:hypothetical protein
MTVSPPTTVPKRGVIDFNNGVKVSEYVTVPDKLYSDGPPLSCSYGVQSYVVELLSITSYPLRDISPTMHDP